MPTVIDSFVVSLGMDPTAFNKGSEAARKQFRGTKDEAKKAATELEASGKQAAQFFTKIQKEALGAFAAIVGTGGLAKFTADTVTSLSAMGRAATAAGVKVSDLAAFRNMIVRNGGSADAATASIQNLAQAMEQFRVTGQTAMLPALNKIGGGRNDTALQVYQKFATWAQGKDAKLVNYEGQQLGLDEGSINKAMQGGGAVKAGLAESYRLGVPTDEDIAKVTKLQGAFFKLRQAIVGDAQAMLYSAAPAMTSFFDGIDGFVEKEPQVTKAILAIGGALSIFGSLKAAAWVLRLLGIGGKAAAVEGATAAATGGGGGVLGALGTGAVALAEAPFIAIGTGVAAWAYGGGMAKDEDRRFNAGQTEAYLLKHGSSAAAARGAAAGVYAEGGKVDGANSIGAYGIGQWLGPRRDRLFAKYGPHPTLPQQLEFLNWELHGGDAGGASVLGSKSSAAAMDAYVRNFMRPRKGDETAGDLKRGTHYLGIAGGHKTPTVTIGTVTIHTKATDAKGIAKDFKKEVSVQANTGLSG